MISDHVSSGQHSTNSAELYRRISEDPELTQSLFRQALQDPNGTLRRIVSIGSEQGLPVSVEEVRSYIISLEDGSTKQWLVKARSGM